MVKIPAALILALALAAAPARGEEPAQFTVNHLPTALAGEWLFRLGHDPGFASPFRERRNWQRIQVPGPWEKHGYPGYDGHAWYRVSLLISSELARDAFALDLGMIGDADEVFVNGRRIGGTGTFPPQFEKATLSHRFYLIPRDTLRFGQLNEIAIHVYNGSRFGGLLGPDPILDRPDATLARAVARDIGAYSMATLLLTLMLLHLMLFTGHREAVEHLAFAGFLLAAAVFILTFARWGPAQLLGLNQNLRLHVVALLAAVGLFPGILGSLGQRLQTRVTTALGVTFAMAAVVALVWRDENTLYGFVYLAEVAIVALLVESIRHMLTLAHRRTPGAVALLASTALLAFVVAVDLLSDIGVVPRTRLLVGALFTPLGLLPFCLTLSTSMAYRWIERRWGEPLDPATGLMPRERFIDRLASEMARSRRGGYPLAVSLLRLSFGDTSSDHEQDRARAVGILRRALRQIDVLGRYDHDTYAVLLTDTPERGAVTIIERLRRATAEGGGGAQTRIHTSAGVAQYRTARHSTAEDFLVEVEAALYAAINEGGNCTATAP